MRPTPTSSLFIVRPVILEGNQVTEYFEPNYIRESTGITLLVPNKF